MTNTMKVLGMMMIFFGSVISTAFGQEMSFMMLTGMHREIIRGVFENPELDFAKVTEEDEETMIVALNEGGVILLSFDDENVCDFLAYSPGNEETVEKVFRGFNEDVQAISTGENSWEYKQGSFVAEVKMIYHENNGVWLFRVTPK